MQVYRYPWVLLLTLPLTCCMASSKSLHLSVLSICIVDNYLFASQQALSLPMDMYND